jgi:hypothetical protein
MATEGSLNIPQRWELAAETIAVKKRKDAKTPRKTVVFALLPSPLAPRNPCPRV